MIAVTAASGNVGRPLTRMLAEAGKSARLLVRDQEAADKLGSAVDVVPADLDSPASLDAALAGVTSLFLLSPGPNTPAQDATAIAAAQRKGVKHIVLLSSLGVELGGIGGGRAHAPGEELLKASGLDWTILRPSEFMTNTRIWLPEIMARGTVSVPSGAGVVGYIDPADIAAVAFVTLTTSGHVGQTYRLTGPETLSVAEAATRVGMVVGKAVRYVDVSDAEFREAALAAHLPEMMIETLSEYYVGVKEGRMNVLTTDVDRVVGHHPGTFADWARANLAPTS